MLLLLLLYVHYVRWYSAARSLAHVLAVAAVMAPNMSDGVGKGRRALGVGGVEHVNPPPPKNPLGVPLACPGLCLPANT